MYGVAGGPVHYSELWSWYFVAFNFFHRKSVAQGGDAGVHRLPLSAGAQGLHTQASRLAQGLSCSYTQKVFNDLQTIRLLGPLDLSFLPFPGSFTAPQVWTYPFLCIPSKESQGYKKNCCFLFKKALPYYFVAKAISDLLILLYSLSTFLSIFFQKPPCHKPLWGKSKIKLRLLKRIFWYVG